MMISTIAIGWAMAAAAQAAPSPAGEQASAGDGLPELRRFGELLATCDNGGRCTVATPGGTIIITREAGRNGALTIRDATGNWTRNRTRWAIDGEVIHDAQGSFSREGADAVALLARLRGASAVVAGGHPVVPANLNAALDWTEARGRRARPVPIIRAPAIPAVEPPALPRTVTWPAIEAAGCQPHPRFEPEISARLLDRRHWLITARRCAGGTIRSVALLVRDGRIAPMRFDVAPAELTPQGTLKNAGTPYGSRMVTVTGSGAGQTSCRDIRRYQWDGRRFRLVHASAAGRCYGANLITWLERWRADVREAPAR